ncbi:MAG: ABC transporter substrate-binding protein [Brevibacterium aurantiacum]|uniref:ABC transporter substrate-binding protein n=1 Tax=Brevibacterium aurantiacum TaxID=273384 RepID=A0A2A3YPN1_BREAU|nr:ABC transporter substrate-binding protein [Brevibacterium aurantiacum]AZT97658.1 ABC transporter substrate-binding protein [Brevibacterium aurantiacum]PCC41209.1 hypothetical protein CIK65_18795 [Brevibacterium aurantiacum]
MSVKWKAAGALSMLVGLSLLASGCGSQGENAESAPTESSESFPVTVKNYYGDATIEAEPKSIVVLEQEEVIEVIQKMGFEDSIAATTYIDVGKQKKYLPEEYVKGGDVYDGDIVGSAPGEVNLENLAEYEPDLIFAPDYADDDVISSLNDLAPVVSTKDGEDSATDIITNAFLALGGTEQDAEEFLGEAKRILTEFGDSVGAEELTMEEIYVAEDALAAPPTSTNPFIESGFKRGPFSEQVVEDGNPNPVSISWEELDKIQSDLVVFAGTGVDAEALVKKDSRYERLPAVEKDLVFFANDPQYENSSSNPPTPGGAQHFVDTFGAEVKSRLSD